MKTAKDREIAHLSDVVRRQFYENERLRAELAQARTAAAAWKQAAKWWRKRMLMFGFFTYLQEREFEQLQQPQPQP